jgi:ABC-type transport system involved in cytochrome bd biosynthesis fused ATPase/permease subunit
MDYASLIPFGLTIICPVFYPRAPLGYGRINQSPQTAGTSLVTFTRVVALLQLALLCLVAYYVPSIWPIVGSWLIIFLVPTVFHTFENVEHGSHLSLFLIMLLNIGLFVFYNLENILAISISAWFDASFPFLKIAFSPMTHLQIGIVVHVIISAIFTFVILFWSNRLDEDDDFNISMERGASVFSKLSFMWLSPLVSLGNKTILKQSDLWKLIPSDTSRVVVERFAILRKNKQWSLYRSLAAVLYHFVAFQWTCALFSVLLNFATPYFFFQIIDGIDKGLPKSTVMFNLVLLLVFTVLKATLDGQMYFTGRRVGTHARTILVSLLYEKSLKRTLAASFEDDAQASVGKIVTLMSVDTERIRNFFAYSHDTLIGIPISIIIATSGLFFVVGYSGLVGIAMIILLGPLGAWSGSMVGKLQEKLMNTTDKRVESMNEMLQGIRIIKYFGWEEYFKKKIQSTREEELNNLFRLWGVYIIFGTIGNGSSIIVAICTFAAHTLIFKQTLTAATAFTALALLKIVSQTLSYLPHMIMDFFKSKVAMERIMKFLDEQEIERFEVLKSSERLNDISEASSTFTLDATEDAVGFKNANFEYHTQQSEEGRTVFQLRKLHVEFPLKGLTVISGPTGGGKSSVLLALLGGILN